MTAIKNVEFTAPRPKAEGWRAFGAECQAQKAVIPQPSPAGWVLNVRQTKRPEWA